MIITINILFDNLKSIESQRQHMIENYQDRSDIYIQRMKHQIIQELTLIITDHQLAYTQKIDTFIRDNQTQSDNLKHEIQMVKTYFRNKQGNMIKQENKRPTTITLLSNNLTILNQKLADQQKQIMEIKKVLSQGKIPPNKIRQQPKIKLHKNQPQNQLALLQQYNLDTISLKSPYLNQFNFTNDGTITKKQNGWVQLLGSETIQKKPVALFHIIKMNKNSVGIGIINQAYVFDQNSYVSQRKQCIRYDIGTGQIWVGGVYKTKAKTIDINELVVMQVTHKQITWRVKHQIRAQVKCQLIIEDRWVPYVLMRDKGDTIKWR